MKSQDKSAVFELTTSKVPWMELKICLMED